jgi:hypothetical protein
MGKEKITKLGIKTSKYYTRICDKCNNEYPNWFTNCPKCGFAWDEAKERKDVTEHVIKNIKILVKITQEDFNESIRQVRLIFSADHGKNWYQVRMDAKMDYYLAEIAEIPIGSIVIYYIEVTLSSGKKFIENNEGKYFYYKVGAPMEETQEEPPEEEVKSIKNLLKNTSNIPQDYKTSFEPPSPKIIPPPNNMTILGKPQTEIDPNLKICPHCNSKIKNLWTICPFCGEQV